jgi:TrkA domain protein
MAEVNQAHLPGVGVLYEFQTAGGRRVGIVHHRAGPRELIVYDRRDPELVLASVRLDDDDSRTLAELLGSSRISQELSHLQQQIEGLAIDWIPIVPGTPYVDRAIGDTQARTRTGVSIVAAIRGETAFPAPGPEFSLEAGDTLVVVGTARGIEALAVLLRTG